MLRIRPSDVYPRAVFAIAASLGMMCGTQLSRSAPIPMLDPCVREGCTKWHAKAVLDAAGEPPEDLAQNRRPTDGHAGRTVMTGTVRFELGIQLSSLGGSI